MKPINNTLFIGKVLIELDACPSTNSYAQELLSKNRPIEGTAIIAYNQHAGRGQFDKVWYSEPYKNLTFSIILYPGFLTAGEQQFLNKAICNAIIDWCAELNLKAGIKWPNDIYFKNYKIGGILIENAISRGVMAYSIVGIGININQFRFPSDIGSPSSLKLITGKDYDIEDCFISILSHIEKWYLHLRNKTFDMIDESFNLNSIKDPW